MYKGYTNNLILRIKEHNLKRFASFTKNRGPWKLVYYEQYNIKEVATNRERFLKSGKGREFLKNIIIAG